VVEAALLKLRLVLALVADREGIELELGEPLETRSLPDGVAFVFPKLTCGVLERGGDGRRDFVWTEHFEGELVDGRLYDVAGRLLFRLCTHRDVATPRNLAGRLARLHFAGDSSAN
jgi:hypothetical protein